MSEYHKIENLYKRDEKTHLCIPGQFRCEEFDYLKDAEWSFTEKVDGMNIRVIWDGSNLSYAGRSDNACLHPHLAQRLRELFEDKATARESIFACPGVVLYGEGYGAGIQKGGGCYSARKDFVLFDVAVDGLWLERENVAAIAAALGLDIVPEVARGPLLLGAEMVQAGLKSAWGDFTAEGLVARPATELKTRRGQRIITKIKHVDFHAAKPKAMEAAA